MPFPCQTTAISYRLLLFYRLQDLYGTQLPETLSAWLTSSFIFFSSIFGLSPLDLPFLAAPKSAGHDDAQALAIQVLPELAQHLPGEVALLRLLRIQVRQPLEAEVRQMHQAAFP